MLDHNAKLHRHYRDYIQVNRKLKGKAFEKYTVIAPFAPQNSFKKISIIRVDSVAWYAHPIIPNEKNCCASKKFLVNTVKSNRMKNVDISFV